MHMLEILSYLLILPVAWLIFVVARNLIARNHNLPWFHTRVCGALYDLGIDAAKLTGRTQELCMTISACHFQAIDQKPNPYVAAIEAFLALFNDYREYYLEIEHARVVKAPRTDALFKIEKWAKKGKISSAEAAVPIATIKAIILEGLREISNDDEELALIEAYMPDL